jgi:hypothetical protein
MWTVLLNENPAAGVTPFRSGGNELPRTTDRDRIRAHTDRAYLCNAGIAESAPRSLLYSYPEAEVTPLEGRVGHVRWRRRFDEDAQWEVALDDVACAV